MSEIWANIIENWEVLIYLAGIMASFIFGGKKRLTKEEKQEIKLAKQHKKNLKNAKKLEKGLQKEKELKEQQNNDTSN